MDPTAQGVSSNQDILSVLASVGRLSPEQVNQIRVESAQTGKNIEELVGSKNWVDPEEIVQAKAKFLGLEYFKEIGVSIGPDLLTLVPEGLARAYMLMPVELDKQKGVLTVVTSKPDDLSSLDFIQRRTGYRLIVKVGSEKTVKDLIDVSYVQSLTGEISDVLKRGEEDDQQTGIRVVTAESMAQLIKEPKIVEIVKKILEHAIRLRASDIHIEPQENITRIRYRIDGILTERLTLDKQYHSALASRIKILGGMKIDERRLPQDGRFDFSSSDGDVDLRISSLPTVHGEKIVMRLLKKSGGVPTLNDLGLRGSALKTLEESISIPHGIILITGPTGSGKTTTLYSILTRLNTARVNIVTLEDPVEYEMPGVNQVQINPQAGLTFSTGLRSFLRQDPNIIMVGEVRDEETAQLAVQASLTGHLVFSTVHTNSAAGALPRLLDMHAEPFLLASTMTAVVGQRVLRRVCTQCKTSFVPEQTVIDDIKNILGSLFKPNGEGGQVVLYKGKGEGCPGCGGSGYQGRVAIFEVLKVNASVAKLVMERSDAGAIEKQAMADGMITMKQDGYLKALEGITTLEEVVRVAQV